MDVIIPRAKCHGASTNIRRYFLDQKVQMVIQLWLKIGFSGLCPKNNMVPKPSIWHAVPFPIIVCPKHLAVGAFTIIIAEFTDELDSAIPAQPLSPVRFCVSPADRCLGARGEGPSISMAQARPSPHDPYRPSPSASPRPTAVWEPGGKAHPSQWLGPGHRTSRVPLPSPRAPSPKGSVGRGHESVSNLRGSLLAYLRGSLLATPLPVPFCISPADRCLGARGP